MLKLSKIFFAFMMIGLFIFLIRTHVESSIKLPQVFTKFRTSMFSHISYLGSAFAKIKNLNNLADQNQQLKNERSKLVSQLAELDSLKEENVFLRKILNFTKTKNMRAVDAGVFNVHFGPDGHIFLINKGSKQGIIKDDIVISESGILIGTITGTTDNSSKAILVSDTSFKATSKILGKDISGMARGGLGNSISLEFISQNDDIVEGDTVVTKGNDLLLSGLILGVISKISQNESNLFKEVSVRTYLSDIDLSRVLVVGR